MALCAVDLSFRGEVLGAHFRVPVLPAGEVGQEKGDGVTHRFWRQHRPVPHLWPWSTSETGHLGRDSIFPGHYDRPGNFPIFRENSQFKLYLQRFQYTNHMEKLTKGRIVAGDLLSIHFSFHPFFCQLAHFHARRWYVLLTSAFPQANHYRAVLAWAVRFPSNVPSGR